MLATVMRDCIAPYVIDIASCMIAFVAACTIAVVVCMIAIAAYVIANFAACLNRCCMRDSYHCCICTCTIAVACTITARVAMNASLCLVIRAKHV